MMRPFRLFVSSSPELAPEREVLGQAVAELPVSIGWEIRHTPGVGESSRGLLAFIEECHLYLIVLGADFAAPMGNEWQRARKTRRIVRAYRKRVVPSPSAQRLLRRSKLNWIAFDSPQELKTQATQALAHILLDRGEKFGLYLDDVEGLLALVEAEKSSKDKKSPDLNRRRGAGKGGVIFGRPTTETGKDGETDGRT